MTAEREAMTLERQAFEKWVASKPDDWFDEASAEAIAWIAWQTRANLSRTAEPVNTTPCPKCGAPCHRTVNMRGGDWGWSTTDEQRAEYEYTQPCNRRRK